MTFDRRRYAREYARRQRAKKLAARMVGALACPKLYGKHPCGGKFRMELDRIGRTVAVCEWCERKAKGLCRECSQPVTGRNIRCPQHKDAATDRHAAKYRATHRKQLNRRALERLENPDARAANNEYKKLWRRMNPDKVRAQKRRQGLKQSPKRRAYSAKYNRTVVPVKAALRLAREIAEGPQPRTCLTPGCAVAMRGRRKKCDGCMDGERARAALLFWRAA